MHPIFRCLAALLCPVVMAVSASAQAPPTRIMPLGDSITYGVGAPGGGGYRNRLYQLLTAAGYTVDFVGNDTANGTASLPDPDHEGHPGWTIGQIDANINGWFNSISDPDVILLHIGTNDFGQNNDTANAINRLDSLITKMATLRPYAHIIVTNLMARSDAPDAGIQNQFNPYVQSRVNAQAALGRRVTFLDMRAAVPLSEMDDGLHPNQAGFNHMADAWFPAVQSVITPQGDALPPGIARALGNTDLTHVSITFSKPVADTAATPTNFTLGGGLTVTGATLDATKRVVTLTTSLQTRGTTYAVTVNGVVDRTPGALPLPANSTVNFIGATARGYANNVPESSGYTLAYSLDIANSVNYGAAPVPYTVDNRDATGPFSRIAYYLELQSSTGDLKYLWASMNAFTTDAGKIGVPTFASGAIFQQGVTGMNVVSNMSGIATGTGLAGNIEFWPTNYDPPNAAGVAGASGTTFDFGDMRSTSGNYGSMQLHNAAAGQTLFAFNNWNGFQAGSNVDLGIGNNPSPVNNGVDWTFSNSGGNYVVKTLQVLVQTIGDTTAPLLSSAKATHGGTQVLVRFNEPVSAASVKPENFSLSNGVVVLGSTLAPNQREVYLLTTAQTPGTPLTLTVSNVRDTSPSANVITPGSSIPVAAPALPPEIVSNVGVSATNYQLVASIDLPMMGNFNGSTAAYLLDDRVANGAFKRVAYYMELQKPGQPSQFVWTSMDAFTASRSKLVFPTLSSGAVFQQNVTNMTVISNVAGVKNGSTATGGNIEFWPNNYDPGNALSVPGASGSTFDTGDIRNTTTNVGYGCMQVHNHDADANQTLFAVNNFGGDGRLLDLGIGNNPSPVNGGVDWTFSGNAASYSKRILHVLVLPGTTLPPAVATNVPNAAGYQLVYSLNIPASGNATTLPYQVNYGGDVGPFTRVGYYMELQTGSATPQFVWASMDAFTTNSRLIGVPTQASGAFFQQKVNNLDVLSNVAGVVNGTTATGGNIEFWPGSYGEVNSIGIPNANGSTFDFGDGNAGTGQGYGSMQVHNHIAGQTLFAFNHFGANSGTTPFCLGIGNNPAPGGSPDWTFADNSAGYSGRVLHVFVLPGNPDTTGPAISRVVPSPTLDRVTVIFNEPVSDSSAVPANFSIPGLTVTGARLLAGQREIALSTTAQVPGTSYMVTVSGIRDRAMTANSSLPGANANFTAHTTPAIFANIPETAGYKLIYQVAIPSTRPGWNVNGVPYAIDDARYGEQLFDRVAYLMELGGTWAYTSFDRHTSSIAKTGVPTFGVTTTPFQQYISNLNVYSNAPGVVNGTGLGTGNIEFWAGNYSGGNALGIPNANGTTLDFGDTMGSGEHGCMQVHNHGAGQTIFSLNNWGESTLATVAVGIGNNPNAGSAGQGGTQMPDWTFTPSAPNHAVKNLYVLVRPGGVATGSGPVLLSQPASRRLNPGDSTTLSISLQAAASVTYQWRFNGVPIPGETRPWLDLVSVGYPQSGSYDVVVTGANLVTSTSKAAIVTVNHPPVFGGYSITTRKNTQAVIARAAILSKASDEEGDVPQLTGAGASSAQGGTVSLAAGGITYVPPVDFLGVDSFQVTLSDGFGGTIPGSILVTVTSAASVAPGQSAVSFRTDGKLDLVFSVAPGQGNAIQRSTTLQAGSWETIITLSAGDDGLLPFTDPEPPGGKAFYRTILAPP